ncbi:MAG: GDP-mannose 4,6-dehydratase [Vicinamibacterales bacterium]
MRHVLVTGGAGFIGSHVVDALLEGGWRVTVLDNFDPFYSEAIKAQNIAGHASDTRFALVRGDVRELPLLERTLPGGYDAIVHLAALAGVRPSIADPLGYAAVNVLGTQNLLELARRWGVPRFIFASSSSVYGVNPDVPWREESQALRPISPYAGTKVAGELLGHVYSHLYGMTFLALRFFTVYGPRQRPDLAIHRFARMILAGQAIPVFGDGSTRRDYTYVSDIVRGVTASLDYDGSRFEVINLGNDRTITLDEMIAELERALGVKATIERLPLQPGDVPQTWASIEKARTLLGYEPSTPFAVGVRRFAEWLAAPAT